MRRSIFALSVASAAAGIAAFALPATAMEDELPEWQQARAIGTAERCIPLRQIRSTEVRDDQTIDFVMTGGRTYRNTMANRCGGLRFERAFSYSTSLSQLCSSDIITVLNRTGGAFMRGASCGLGEFTPIEFPEDAEE
ncbi:hypothetical protein [Parasphingopyxis marina]|uniref:Protease inhibitor Inh n=1 Tax=Parasphingopyxis marina TaxID=2761622 RepID=A0A842HYX6_9SPHN|nr:hypothetical protein [Parasphingopyxis marina]MBC2777130.1 hypothetical protein [Parasphingopyxis marina]